VKVLDNFNTKKIVQQQTVTNCNMT